MHNHWLLGTIDRSNMVRMADSASRILAITTRIPGAVNESTVRRLRDKSCADARDHIFGLSQQCSARSTRLTIHELLPRSSRASLLHVSWTRNRPMGLEKLIELKHTGLGSELFHHNVREIVELHTIWWICQRGVLTGATRWSLEAALRSVRFQDSYLLHRVGRAQRDSMGHWSCWSLGY
jgi:hypothetical protein